MKNFNDLIGNELEHTIATDKYSISNLAYEQNLLESEKLLNDYKDKCTKSINILYNQAKAGFDMETANRVLFDVLQKALPKNFEVKIK